MKWSTGSNSKTLHAPFLAAFALTNDPKCRDDEVVTPHQTTLLKLVDSYLHGSQRAHEVALASRPATDRGALFDVLIEAFLVLSSYTQTAINAALASGHASPATESDATTSTGVEPHAIGLPPLQNLDLLLPKVCEALVLVTQCLTTVALRAEEAAATPNANAPVASKPVHPSPKRILAAAKAPSGQGLVEGLIGTCQPGQVHACVYLCERLLTFC